MEPRRPLIAGRTRSTRFGTVRDFDVARGIGIIEEDDGQSHMFHCTVIADGSRSIEVDERVEFNLRPGGPGRWEAFTVSPTAASPSDS